MSVIMNKNSFKYLAAAIAFVMFACQLFTTSVSAADIPIELRTVPLNETTNIVLTQKDIAKGKKLFSNACATCHLSGNYKQYTCHGCHEHQQARIIAEHREEGITNIQNCVRCHRSPHGDAEGEREGGERED